MIVFCIPLRGLNNVRVLKVLQVVVEVGNYKSLHRQTLVVLQRVFKGLRIIM